VSTACHIPHSYRPSRPWRLISRLLRRVHQETAAPKEAQGGKDGDQNRDKSDQGGDDGLGTLIQQFTGI